MITIPAKILRAVLKARPAFARAVNINTMSGVNRTTNIGLNDW